jgi:methionyl-tRNA formyltransferase
MDDHSSPALEKCTLASARMSPTDKMIKNYIIASAKEWHRPGFDALRVEIPEKLTWVTTPDALLDAVERCKPRYVFFLHWSWRVPALVCREFECICFHMTDVPFGRGGSPLQNLIAGGHKDTRLSALRMVEALDAGPIYAKRPLSLNGKAQDIYLRAGQLSFDLIRWIVANEPVPTPQSGKPTLFKRRATEQSVLPDTGTLESIYDHIRMLDADSYPHAFIEYGDFRIELRDAQLDEQGLHARILLRKR